MKSPDHYSANYLAASQSGHRAGSGLELMPRRKLNLWGYVLPGFALLAWVPIILAAWVGTR